MVPYGRSVFFFSRHLIFAENTKLCPVCRKLKYFEYIFSHVSPSQYPRAVDFVSFYIEYFVVWCSFGLVHYQFLTPMLIFFRTLYFIRYTFRLEWFRNVTDIKGHKIQKTMSIKKYIVSRVRQMLLFWSLWLVKRSWLLKPQDIKC